MLQILYVFKGLILQIHVLNARKSSPHSRERGFCRVGSLPLSGIITARPEGERAGRKS